MDDVSLVRASEAASEVFLVDLAEFSGPLDLLLSLIRDEQVDIYDCTNGNRLHTRSGDELISRAASVLAGGGTVWVAGFPLYEESAAYVAKPERATGIAAADLRWSNQLAALLKTARAQVVVAPDPKVAGHERAMLVAFRQ